MNHPFSKMFEKALLKSYGDENFVLAEAEKLMKKGYSPNEIYTVLVKLEKSLIQDADVAILSEAVEEFSQYVDHPDEEVLI